MFVFVWFVILLETTVGGKRLLPRTTTETAMVALLLAIIAVMLTRGMLVIRQFLNGYAIPFAMFVCAKNSFNTRKEVQRFLLWLAVPLSIYFPMNAFFEHYSLDQFVFPRYILSPVISGVVIEWHGRAMGPFLQPVATGTAMTAMYVLSMYRLSSVRGFLSKAIRFFITVITPPAIFFTYTRSVYMGFFVALMIMLFSSRKQRLVALMVILAVSIGVLGNWSAITSEDREAGGMATKSTAQSRLVLIDVSLKMFADRPFVGVGLARFLDYSPEYVKTVRTTFLGYREHWIGQSVNQHNHFLSVLTEIGLIGFVPLMIIYFTLFRTLRKAYYVEAENYDKELVVCVWAIWAAHMVNVMFIEPRFFEFMNAFPYICAGIIVGGYQRAKLKQAVSPRVRERS
jgi:O-antigen ligase